MQKVAKTGADHNKYLVLFLNCEVVKKSRVKNSYWHSDQSMIDSTYVTISLLSNEESTNNEGQRRSC